MSLSLQDALAGWGNPAEQSAVLRNEMLRLQAVINKWSDWPLLLDDIYSVASGEKQVASDDSEGMAWIADRIVKFRDVVELADTSANEEKHPADANYPPSRAGSSPAIPTTEILKEIAAQNYETLNENVLLKSDNAKLRKALVGLVGADGPELDGMEALIRISPHAPDEDRAVTINAIHVLRETKTARKQVCNCVGKCRGAAGLGEGWVCALESGNPIAKGSWEQGCGFKSKLP